MVRTRRPPRPRGFKGDRVLPLNHAANPRPRGMLEARVPPRSRGSDSFYQDLLSHKCNLADCENWLGVRRPQHAWEEWAEPGPADRAVAMGTNQRASEAFSFLPILQN